jgi:hypothetical protein
MLRTLLPFRLLFRVLVLPRNNKNEKKSQDGRRTADLLKEISQKPQSPTAEGWSPARGHLCAYGSKILGRI